MTNASDAKASALKRLERLPMVKTRFLNKDRSRTGDLVCLSIDRKITVRTRLVKSNKTVIGESRPPRVRPRRRLVMATENVTAPGMSNCSLDAGAEISRSLLRDQYVPYFPEGSLKRN